MTSSEFIDLGGLAMAKKFNSACRLECWKHYDDIVDACILKLVEMA
jgi:hypothetical protein